MTTFTPTNTGARFTDTDGDVSFTATPQLARFTAAYQSVTGGGGGGASALDDLTDVTLTSPSNGQVLKYNGSAWVNGTDSGGGEVYVQSSAPSAPSNADTAVWFPIPAGLVSFVDFRGLPDGALADLLTETNGAGSVDPLAVTQLVSPSTGVAGIIQNGRLTHAQDSDPRRNILVLTPGTIGSTWRITFGHGGITEKDTALGIGESAESNITFTIAAENGDGYILHTTAFEKATAGLGSGNATYIAIGRDDDGTAVLSYTPPEIAVVERFMEPGDRIALASEGSNVYKGYLNNVEQVTFTDSTYNPATLDTVSLPVNSLDGSVWRNGIEWVAVTTGADFEPDRDLLPPHRWNGTEWVPMRVPMPTAMQSRLLALTDEKVARPGGATNSNIAVFADGGRSLGDSGVSTSSFVAKSVVDAKGDLLVATAADTVTRLPVGGTNGHVLTVDSAEAAGVKWAAASGGGSSPLLDTLGAQTPISESATDFATLGVNAVLLDTAYSLPACAAGDVIEFVATVTYNNQSGATRQPRGGFRLGSTNCVSSEAISLGNAPTGVTSNFVIRGTIHVLTTGSQRLICGFNTDRLTGSFGNHTAATEDFTGALNLQITFGTNNASGTQTATLQSLHITRMSLP